ncbi:MAG: co-chaperone GroES [Ardenticatenales bacterium]|nr:co-chaperone GroES [Ardenticatenales bacterium]
MATTLTPLSDRVIVEPTEREDTTPSGIILPDTAREKPQEGTIIAVGKGKIDESGNRQPLDVAEGDRVIFAKYAGTEFKLEGDRKVLILKENDLLAIVSRS